MLSKGCHILIKQGTKLVDDAADIMGRSCGCGLPLPAGAAGGASRAVPGLSSHWLLAHMAFDRSDIDALAGRAGLPVHEVSAALVELEMAGAVASLPGGLW